MEPWLSMQEVTDISYFPWDMDLCSYMIYVCVCFIWVLFLYLVTTFNDITLEKEKSNTQNYVTFHYLYQTPDMTIVKNPGIRLHWPHL